jgi:predicted enzyme related to lactoylglutathione lyase
VKQKYQIDYLEFPSTGAARSRTFYAEAFGWSSTTWSGAYETMDDAGIGMGIDSSAAPSSMPLAVIRTEDLEQAERDVVAAGGIIVRPAFDFPGGRRFHFREPGGVELAVYVERPAA